ncbi:DNA-binding SARP family transcriptional activator/Tfp pilus assembly protein PilF [Amycolatopsis bartoniae]|uniref:SARP family transcriptional regulator n=1 Tax=Amycolatopsis bartoniae TaxID=941986 RepID=A0A8H9M4H9_9PSEU|nr:DNA-binding SARP family transcriptional activator/Tfp pilus assembly protein PilF [Amycolatopsis bartoniae]GHF48127.1 SARP family transcriptional regulator [Amycolatopsis bartoniae]
MISFRILGPLEVVVAGRTIALGGPKPRLLLAALLLQPNVVVSTDALVEVLWPGSAPRSAAANIRTYVHSLRRRLAEADPLLAERIQGRAGGYVATVEPGELDSAVFEQCLAQAEAVPDPQKALSALGEAAELWRGEVLEDLPHSHTWSSAVARLTELRLSAEEQRIRWRIGLGEHAEAVAELRALLADHPLREELWQQLILALDACGRRAEALTAYTQAERVLREELDAEPGPQLRQVRARLTTAAEPQQLPANPVPMCQLPLDLPDFTGREDLVADLVALLEECRDAGRPAVVVLSGAPGVGKSALAVRVAHTMRTEFPDGQLHIDLRGTAESPRRPLDVLPELLRALGVPDSAMPRQLDERSALLRARLAGRRLCIVLDDAGNAAQVRPLLPGAGASAVIVTSRVRMPDLESARTFDVNVLPDDEATNLLSTIVGSERLTREPEGAAAILRACGRLPLAIRVAGARLSHRPNWTLARLADRLSDEHRRLDELRVGDLAVRASVTLSYDQLPGSAARAFRGLGLLGPVQFPGWVVGAVLDRPDGDDVLDVLVDAHLVELVAADVSGQPRYRLHDLLRVYAAEQAEAEPLDERRGRVRRVLEGYLSLATEAAEHMPIHFFGVVSVPRDDVPWRPANVPVDPGTWFEAELRTGVAMVELAARWGFDDLAWRLTAALTPYFDLRGHHDDWQRTHEIALSAARRSGDRHGQAIVLRNLGQIDLYRDAYDEALDAFEQSLRLFREIGDASGAGIALAGLGTVRRVAGENERALDHCHEALELFARAGNKHGEAVVRIAVGTVWLAQNCFATAGRWFTDAYELSAEIGDRHREAHALQRLALLHQSRGNLGAAREELDRAIAIFDELGDDHCVGYAHQSLGKLYLMSGDLAHARLLLVNSLSVHQRNGDRRSEAETAELLGELHERLNQPDKAREYLARSLGIWHELQVSKHEEALRERLRALGGQDLLTLPGA